MQEHRYKFPEGMEDVAQDYVEAKWAFVAIKTKIGAKSNIEPTAGMRNVDTSYPKGLLDGYVQGMGFRFPSEEGRGSHASVCVQRQKPTQHRLFLFRQADGNRQGQSIR